MAIAFHCVCSIVFCQVGGPFLHRRSPFRGPRWRLGRHGIHEAPDPEESAAVAAGRGPRWRRGRNGIHGALAQGGSGYGVLPARGCQQFRAMCCDVWSRSNRLEFHDHSGNAVDYGELGAVAFCPV
jgi:hypothetical protein